MPDLFVENLVHKFFLWIKLTCSIFRNGINKLWKSSDLFGFLVILNCQIHCNARRVSWTSASEAQTALNSNVATGDLETSRFCVSHLLLLWRQQVTKAGGCKDGCRSCWFSSLFCCLVFVCPGDNFSRIQRGKRRHPIHQVNAIRI